MSDPLRIQTVSVEGCPFDLSLSQRGRPLTRPRITKDAPGAESSVKVGVAPLASRGERLPPGKSPHPPSCRSFTCKRCGFAQAALPVSWSQLHDLPAQVSQTGPRPLLRFVSCLTLLRGS